MMRVLICRANAVAPDPRVEKTSRALSEGGYAVQILGWDRSGALPCREEHNEVLIQRIRLRSLRLSGLLNIFPLICWTIWLFFWLYRHRKSYDVIHACDLDTVLPALWAKRLWGKRVVYDIFDFYADMLRKTPGWVTRWVRKVEISAIDRADALILADDSRRQQIEGASPRRVAVIYNAPEDTPDLSGFDHGSKFRLAYFGNLQVERGLLHLLAVLSRHLEWNLDLGGSGPDEAQIVAQARQLPNVTWHGILPYEQVIQLSRKADILVATYDPAIPNHRYSSPNKVFEAMMLSKPVVVAKGSGVDRLVEQNECGVNVPYGDEAALENVLEELSSDQAKRLLLGGNGRRAYEKSYSWSCMEERLLTLYAEVFAEGPRE